MTRDNFNQNNNLLGKIDQWTMVLADQWHLVIAWKDVNRVQSFWLLIWPKDLSWTNLLEKTVLRTLLECSQKECLAITRCQWSCMASLKVTANMDSLCETTLRQTTVRSTDVQSSTYFYLMCMATFIRKVYQSEINKSLINKS